MTSSDVLKILTELELIDNSEIADKSVTDRFKSWVTNKVFSYEEPLDPASLDYFKQELAKYIKSDIFDA